VASRPYVLLSAAMSADGYLDDAASQRLILSDAADLDRVDAVRAASDAILVGGETIRRDNPALRVRSAVRREQRLRRGLSASPARVTLTSGGDLDPAARFFADDGIDKLVYTPAAAAGPVRERLGGVATVVGCGDPLSLPRLLDDLAGRGVGTLMVEGGATVLSQFLSAGLADEFQLAVAPLRVADETAPRLLTGVSEAAALGQLSPLDDLGALARPGGAVPGRRLAELRLTEVSRSGRMVVLRYQLTEGIAG
jgi:5-amino-6-(5-phosphoribosylamino)uracil reductase